MEGGTAGLDIGQAAAALGVSVDVVRKRVRRGNLRAYKVDGRWKVVLPTVQEAVQGNGQDSPGDNGLDHGQDSNGRAALIAQLQTENDRLWRLTEHQAGVIAQMSARMAALLPAPRSAPDVMPELPEFLPDFGKNSTGRPPAPPLPQRTWWQRLFRLTSQR